MKPIKLRTKIEAVGLGLLLIALSIVGVFGVTRTITSSSDTYETLIRNSNGKYWEATGANIQTAIWDLNSTNGGTVWLPSGILTITKPIVWRNCTDLIGTGKTVIKLSDANTNPMMVIIGWTNFGGHSFGSVTNVHDVLIENIQFDGNNDSNTWESYSHGIEIGPGSKHITIRNCVINNTLSDCINIFRWIGNPQAEFVTVENCVLRDIERYSGDYPGGVYISGKYCTVRNCFINNTWGSGIIFEDEAANSANNIVDGNYITGKEAFGIYSEANNSHNNTIINNLIIDLVGSNAYGGGIKDACGILLSKDCYCAGNIIANITHPGTGGGSSNICLKSYGECIIINNIIYNKNNNGDGIYLMYSGAHPATSYIISENKIYNCNYGIVSSTSLSFKAAIISGNYIENSVRGISCGGGVDNVTISTNFIKTFSGYGIYSSDGVNCIITENKCIGAGTGIYLHGNALTSNNNTVALNNLHMCGTPLTISAGSNTLSNITLNIV